MTQRRLSEWPRLAAGLAAVAAVTAGCRWLGGVNAATVSTTFLLVVLVVAATSRLWVALTVSAAAVLCFNFFFLPPLGTFVVAEPQNWLALISFFAVSLVASNLSAVARARTAEALGRRDEQARLFDLSRDVLVLPDSRAALTALARAVPAALAGVVLMLWVTGTSLNVQSVVGATMAVGIGVANAILLVAFAEAARCGHGIDASPDAAQAALRGASGRLRAVLMTASAMVVGMVPMALGLGDGGAQAAPLGRAVIGGLTAATVATLFVVPAVYACAVGAGAKVRGHECAHGRLQLHKTRHRGGVGLDHLLRTGAARRVRGACAGPERVWRKRRHQRSAHRRGRRGDATGRAR